MPFGSEGVEPGISLALSGGGFRATLFHIGSGWRLLELGVLPRVARISSVSGGAIFSGTLASRWEELTGDFSVSNYQRLVVEPLRQFCRLPIDAVAIGEGLLTPWKTVSDAIESKYREMLFQSSLERLVDSPCFVFNATNLQTGRSFRFSKPYMGDYRIGLIRNPSLSLAKVVAASSAFPPFCHLSLLTIQVSSKQWKVPTSMAGPNTLSVFISATVGYTTTSASKPFGIDIRQYW